MEMFRHEDPAEEEKVELGADRLEGLDEEAGETRGGKNGNAAIGAAGDKLQLARFEVTMVKGHQASMALASGADLKGKVCASLRGHANIPLKN